MNHLGEVHSRRTLDATTCSAKFLPAIELPIVFPSTAGCLQCSKEFVPRRRVELLSYRSCIWPNSFNTIDFVFAPLFLEKFHNDAKRLRIIHAFMKIALFIECDADEWRLIDWLKNCENCATILRWHIHPFIHPHPGCHPRCTGHFLLCLSRYCILIELVPAHAIVKMFPIEWGLEETPERPVLNDAHSRALSLPNNAPAYDYARGEMTSACYCFHRIHVGMFSVSRMCSKIK